MTTQFDLERPLKTKDKPEEVVIPSPPSPTSNTSSWQWFYDQPVQRKQFIGLLAAQAISFAGLVGGASFLIVSSGRTQLLNQAKSELAATEINYNIKIDQMGFGFRGQADNGAIVAATKADAEGEPIPPKLQSRIREILSNEIRARNIEYATLVGKDLQIIANANAERTGEKFDPNGLVTIALQQGQQVKTTAIAPLSELQKEAPPLPKGLTHADTLIRYTVTPVKDPDTGTPIGALVSGDVVNGKLPIVENTVQAFGSGYSAVYLRKPNGEFTLATSLLSGAGNPAAKINEEIPDRNLLNTAVAAPEQVVFSNGKPNSDRSDTYTLAAKALLDRNGQPVAVLVRGTSEAAFNSLLRNNLLMELAIAAIVIAVNLILAKLLGRAIADPVKQLQQTTQKFSQGDRGVRAQVFAQDEIGQLAQVFNQLADRVTASEAVLRGQAYRQQALAERSRLLNDAIANMRQILTTEEILNSVVQELRQALNADRAIAYRFQEDWTGTIVAESVAPGWREILGEKVNDTLREDLLELYRNGRVRTMNDIYTEDISDCHRQLLESLEIRASIVAPIVHNEQLIGLLCAYQCSGARTWEDEEIDLVAKLGVQLGFALEQASLLKQQRLNAEYAQRLNAISLQLRYSLNQQQVFQSCVNGLRAALEVERAIIYLFDEHWSGTIVAESVAHGWPAALGATITDPCFINNYVEKYKQGRVQATENIFTAGLTECHLNQLKPFEVKANIVAPILVEGELLGLLICHQCSRPRAWHEAEINLLRQVAIQLDFALEQSNLLEQREQARLQAERLFEEQRQQKESIQRQLIDLLEDIEGAARGDLTVRADVTAGDIGTVADFFNSIVESLRQIVTQVKQSTLQVNASLGENEGAIRQLAEVALKQAQETRRTLDSVEQMTQSIQAVAQSAHQAAQVARTASATAESGETAMDLTVQNILSLRETVSETAKKVKRLGESSQQISKVVSLINQIALQTNLLAINAGIEAARAGEEGQGFAVVAEEVGALAARSANATQEIERIVETIQRETSQVVEAMEQSTTQVVEGTRLVEDTKQSLGQILEVSYQIDQLVQSISQATVSQVKTAEAVSSLMQEIARSSDLTSNSSRQVSHSLRQTVEIAQQLQTSVGTFKVGNG